MEKSVDKEAKKPKAKERGKIVVAMKNAMEGIRLCISYDDGIKTLNAGKNNDDDKNYRQGQKQGLWMMMGPPLPHSYSSRHFWYWQLERIVVMNRDRTWNDIGIDSKFKVGFMLRCKVNLTKLMKTIRSILYASLRILKSTMKKIIFLGKYCSNSARLWQQEENPDRFITWTLRKLLIFLIFFGRTSKTSPLIPP